MQSEGELRLCISLCEIFVNLDFKNMDLKIIVIQSRNTIHERINGVKSENLHKIKFDYSNLRFHIEILFYSIKRETII